MKTLKDYILEADANQKAIGHFNVSNIEGLWAVFHAAKDLSDEIGEDIPVIVGVSEGERDNIGLKQAVLLVKSLRMQFDYPIFINADHSYSFERAQKAIQAGCDMVIIDLAEEGYDENLKATQKVIEFKKSIDSDCLIESELGYIGSGSNIKEDLPEGVSDETKTKPDEAKTFVDQTGLDLLAPSVGNVHGMIKSGNPSLDPERVKEVREACGVPLVLHGGSGSSDEDFLKVIDAGISVIHISTELRIAFREALEKSLKENDTLSPYKYLKPAKEAMQEAVAKRIKLFWKI